MFEYELPDVGEGVAEGEIVVWHVSPGDRVTEDQVLAEVETDKAVVDLPAPVDGVVRELHAEAGEMVAVGSVVVSIDTEPEDDTVAAGTGTDDVAATTAAAGEADAEPAGTAEGRVFAPPNVRRVARELGVDIQAVEGSGPSGRITEGDVRAAAEVATETTSETDQTAEADAAAENGQRQSATRRREPATRGATAINGESADRDRTLAVPATRRVARELDIDIDEVPTDRSRDGEAFVEPEDVRAYAETRQTTETATTADPTTEPPAEATETAVTEAVTSVEGVETTDAAAAETTDAAAAETTDVTAAETTDVTAAETTDVAAAETGEGVRREPYRGVRRTIGQRMAESAYTAPHASHHDMAVVPGLVEAREQLKPHAETEGVHLTYMPFVMKAVAATLPDYPSMNAELDEESEEIRYYSHYNIGVAVATDAGLMVPVVEDVDQKGLLDIAREVNDLVERARNRELAPEEFQGSTFTITNFGAIGGEYATPILNYPETGILGLGAIRQRPVVEDGDVVARHSLPLSVSIDHRVVDGADSAGFCNDLKTYLADPVHLLL